MISINCLCLSCSKKCGENMKAQLAMLGKLTYIYLKRGGKLANTCSLYDGNSLRENTSIFLGREGLLKIT